MSDESSGILAGEEGGVILVQVNGRGTHENSHLLKQYLIQCLGEKRRAFQVNLSRCAYMDSTFLGMLAGFGSRARERSLPTMRLVNASERIRGMLESLGIESLFEFVTQQTAAASLHELRGPAVSKEEKSREMLEAHEKLVEISPSNAARFRDVIALLREKAGKTGPP